MAKVVGEGWYQGVIISTSEIKMEWWETTSLVRGSVVKNGTKELFPRHLCFWPRGHIHDLLSK